MTEIGDMEAPPRLVRSKVSNNRAPATHLGLWARNPNSRPKRRKSISVCCFHGPQNIQRRLKVAVGSVRSKCGYRKITSFAIEKCLRPAF